MAEFHVRDWSNSGNALTRSRGKPKGKLIAVEVKAEREDREELAVIYRSRGLKVEKFERIIHADNCSIWTYVLTAREPLPK
jgi:hypothetical protein